MRGFNRASLLLAMCAAAFIGCDDGGETGGAGGEADMMVGAGGVGGDGEGGVGGDGEGGVGGDGEGGVGGDGEGGVGGDGEGGVGGDGEGGMGGDGEGGVGGDGEGGMGGDGEGGVGGDGEGGMGGDGEGGMGGMIMPPDLDCGELPVFDGAFGPVEDGVWRVAGVSGPSAEAVGTCAGDGNESIVPFEAVDGGWYTFTTVHPDTDFDTALHVRSDCTDAESELACNDDIGGLQSGVVVQLDAGAVAAVFVDAFGGEGGAWTLTAIRAEANAAPELADGQALTTPNDGTLVIVDGDDANGDVVGLLVQYLAGEELLGEEPIPAGLYEGQYGRRSFELIGNVDPAEGADGIRVWAIDSQENLSEPLDLELEAQPLGAEGDDCDPRRILNGCAEGLFCPQGEASVCTEPTAPTLMMFEAFYNEDASTLGLRVAGTDPDADVAYLRIELFDAEGTSILGGEEDGPAFVEFDDLVQVDGNYTGTASGRLQGLAPVARVRVWVGDGLELESDPMEADVQAPADLALDDPCDPFGAFGVCPDGAACIGDDELTCGAIAVPAITEAMAWFNPAGPTLAIQISGTDGDDDTDGFQIQLLDDAGEIVPIAGDDTPFQLGFATVEPDGDGFVGRFSGLLPEDQAPFAQVRLWLLDQQGQLSEPVDVAPMDTPVVERGAECDLAGGFSTCAAGDVCFDDDFEDDAPPVCIEPQAECPADWEVVDLNANAVDGGWQVAGDNTGAPVRDAGSCGGGAGQDVYSFTAPAAGDYVFATAGDADADTVLYIRRFCGLAGPESEIACNDDAGGATTSAAQIALEADETVYVFVDGFTFFEGWQGPYELSVTAAVEPVLEEASIWLNRETGALTAEILGTADSFGGVRYALLDGEDAVLAEGTWNGDVEVDGDAIAGEVYGNVAEENRANVTSARLWVQTAVGGESEPLLVDMILDPAQVAVDAACDPRGARNVCVDSDCFDGGEGFVCTVLEAGCPDDWTVVDLNENAIDGGWAFDGDLTREGLEEHGAGSCGFVTGFNDLYSFTAPAAGTYVFETAGEGGDTVMWARDACGVPDAELACNDDIDFPDNAYSAFELQLGADETVYVFVDSFEEEGRSLYRLTVSAALPE